MGREAEAPSPSLPRIGDKIAGKYVIDRILATGGMGVVVAAKHMHLDQRVAIKFLLPEMLDRDELVARFLREAQATVGLHGEHAVRVFDVGTLDSGSPYLVMELLRGNDLDEELEVRGPLEIDEALDFILQACEAIAEAHRIGIVHRDIKPSNLFLARRPDGTRCVKVVDFGISKLLADEAQRETDSKLTTTTAMLGSPQYMSPEQVRSAKDVDSRSDIWSLGCVLYEMLANVPPFAAETVSAVSAMIVADEPPPLASLRGDAPPELCAVVMRCLEKNRRDRFQTVADLADALAPVVSPRTRQAAERVIRISKAPRYESSFPPPDRGFEPEEPGTITARRVEIDPASTTISEVTYRSRPGDDEPSEHRETLSATASSSHHPEGTYNRRNGLLVGAAALLAGVSVWAVMGRAPAGDGPREHPPSSAAEVQSAPAPKEVELAAKAAPPPAEEVAVVDDPVTAESDDLTGADPEPVEEPPAARPKPKSQKKKRAVAKKKAKKPEPSSPPVGKQAEIKETSKPSADPLGERF